MSIKNITVLYSLLLSFSSYSETLDIIEVRADKELADFNLGSFESLSDADLDRSNSSQLSSSLSNVGGVTPTQNGGPGSRVSYFIRGTEARHVSFTIDGLKINDSSNTDRQYDAAFLSQAFLKNVTLYKGPQAVLFGSDAFGGLVDMKTRKGESAPETRFSLNVGSFGTVDSSLSNDWNTKKSQGTLTWSSMRTDGISRLNKKRFNAHERDGALVTQLSSSSRHNWGVGWQSDFLMSFLRGANELDGASDDNSHDKSKSDQYLAQQKTTRILNSHMAISLRNGFSRHQRSVETLSSGSDRFGGNLVQHEGLLNFEKDNIHLLGGVASESESIHQKSLEKSTLLNSAFVQGSWSKFDLKIQSGLRIENHSLYGDFQTGSAGLAHSFGAETLSLQYSQGFKAPSLYQLYGRPYLGRPVGNKNLIPERNNSFELKLGHVQENLRAEASLFQNRLQNLITYTNQGYVNQGRFIAEGLELNFDLTLERIRIRPSFLHQEFKEEKTSILRRPMNQKSLELAWFPNETMEIFTKYKDFDGRKDMDLNGKTVKLNGFYTVDLGVRLSKGPSDYGIQIVNIFDREYEELYGYSVMPRSILAHLGRKF